MGKGIAVLGIWLAVGIIGIYAPKSVDSIVTGAMFSTLAVAFFMK